ncbi:Hypothetical protein LUCI_0422 [Lucifera butyrica]|uniref:2Fe-2S ferredoxin-type domain-containing protein n=1 Tax=Lucifera butyrica TaxID=1351585 RepID=A0A498R227_9FIRM|nr:(2Fe-2S)-binding protein [Lucifera butyrica]VBB05215.1 Hypothetical protein LUCI_0422 [Lucifera butyrica]
MFQMLTKGLIELTVNGEKRRVVANPSDTLLFVLRTQLGLTGAKPGCENGDCGACTVLVDGWPQKSCLALAVEMTGRDIVTVEGLKDAPAQKAFLEQWGFQCGYCTSGFLMVCHALSRIHPNASNEVLVDWLQSNLCRCTSYEEIERAVRSIIQNSEEMPSLPS